MIGVMLLYVGAVLLVDGVWILGTTRTAAAVGAEGAGEVAVGRARPGASLMLGSREVGVFNIFVGVLGFILALAAILRVGPASIGALELEFGALVLLFAFTYLYVGINQFVNADGRALGWFCLFVAITAVPTAIITLLAANGRPWPIWLGVDWAIWAVLWFLFFVLLALQAPIARLVGGLTILVAIVTAWIPGYLLLTRYLPGT